MQVSVESWKEVHNASLFDPYSVLQEKESCEVDNPSIEELKPVRVVAFWVGNMFQEEISDPYKVDVVVRELCKEQPLATVKHI